MKLFHTLPISAFTFVFAFVLAMVNTASLPAQETEQAGYTVDSILDDYIEALGGEMSLISIESLRFEFRFTGGTLATGKKYAMPTRYISIGEYENHGSHCKLFQNGDWYRRSNNGITFLVCGTQDIDSSYTFNHSPFFALRLSNNADEMSVLPSDEYESDPDFAECRCLTTGNTNETHLRRFFDSKSGLLVGIQSWVSKTGGPPKFRLQSKLGYQEVEGTMIVSRSERTNRNGWVTECVYTNMEFNVELDEDVFDIGELPEKEPDADESDTELDD